MKWRYVDAYRVARQQDGSAGAELERFVVGAELLSKPEEPEADIDCERMRESDA